jgi:hypothetical protein
VPEFLGQFVQVEAAQDVVEGFGAHVGAEDLSPALLQFAVAAFAQEGQGAQFEQFIAQAGVLVLRGEVLIFPAGGASASICSSASALHASGFHLNFFQLALFSSRVHSPGSPDGCGRPFARG